MGAYVDSYLDSRRYGGHQNLSGSIGQALADRINVMLADRPLLTCPSCDQGAVSMARLTCGECGYRVGIGCGNSMPVKSPDPAPVADPPPAAIPAWHVWDQPAPTCRECGGRGSTGMGPCSICTDPAIDRRPPPLEILRVCPRTGNLSLRLDQLFPDRDVALRQVGDAMELMGGRNDYSDAGFCLLESMVELRDAIAQLYPRTRHLREIEAEFVDYVRGQVEGPPKGKDKGAANG